MSDFQGLMQMEPIEALNLERGRGLLSVLWFGLFGLASLHSNRDVGHGSAVWSSMPVVFAGWNDHHVPLLHGNFLGVSSALPCSFGDD